MTDSSGDQRSDRSGWAGLNSNTRPILARWARVRLYTSNFTEVTSTGPRWVSTSGTTMRGVLPDPEGAMISLERPGSPHTFSLRWPGLWNRPKHSRRLVGVGVMSPAMSDRDAHRWDLRRWAAREPSPASRWTPHTAAPMSAASPTPMATPMARLAGPPPVRCIAAARAETTTRTVTARPSQIVVFGSSLIPPPVRMSGHRQLVPAGVGVVDSHLGGGEAHHERDPGTFT